MPKRPEGEKRPADAIGTLIEVMRIASDEKDDVTPWPVPPQLWEIWAAAPILRTWRSSGGRRSLRRRRLRGGRRVANYPRRDSRFRQERFHRIQACYEFINCSGVHEHSPYFDSFAVE